MGDTRAWFDGEAFYAALDAIRQPRGLTWKHVAAGSGVSASTLSRMAQGRRPDVDGLAALAAWAGLRVDDFIRGASERPEPEPLSKVLTALHDDPQLSADAATALSGIVLAAYDALRSGPSAPAAASSPPA